ncbi:urotensin-2 isoform X1 [Nycticebus coucang]|uniref:urotensin-2 isoform X1 n=1 Tax=Nycticebus coucang TaxID=9470 RepID=UPI00234D0D2A|nr:urotensin-2 isoform X1 [Nycticebus coucang]
MCQLASCCLLLIGFLNPFLCLPITDSREVSLQLSAPREDARLTRMAPGSGSLLQVLLEMLGAEREDGLRNAGEIIPVFIGCLIPLLLNLCSIPIYLMRSNCILEHRDELYKTSRLPALSLLTPPLVSSPSFRKAAQLCLVPQGPLFQNGLLLGGGLVLIILVSNECN